MTVFGSGAKLNTEADIPAPPGPPPEPSFFSELLIEFDATKDTEASDDTAQMQLTDQTGNGHHALWNTAVEADQHHWRDGTTVGTPTGKPVFERLEADAPSTVPICTILDNPFDGGGTEQPAAELWIVLAAENDPGTSGAWGGGPQAMGESPSNTQYPGPDVGGGDRNIADNFGQNALILVNLGVFPATQDVTKYHTYSVACAAPVSTYEVAINNTNIFSQASAAMDWENAPRMWKGGGDNFGGTIAAMYVFPRKLTVPERLEIFNYLDARYITP